MTDQHITDELNFDMHVVFQSKGKPPKKQSVYNFQLDSTGGLTYYLGNKDEIREINYINGTEIKSVRGIKIKPKEPSPIITPDQAARVPN